jgi:hypothetical protein
MMDRFWELYTPWSIRLPILGLWALVALFAGFGQISWLGLALPWLLVWFLVLFRGQPVVSFISAGLVWLIWLIWMAMSQIIVSGLTGSLLVTGQILAFLLMASCLAALIAAEDIKAAQA